MTNRNNHVGVPECRFSGHVAQRSADNGWQFSHTRSWFSSTSTCSSADSRRGHVNKRTLSNCFAFDEQFLFVTALFPAGQCQNVNLLCNGTVHRTETMEYCPCTYA